MSDEIDRGLDYLSSLAVFPTEVPMAAAVSFGIALVAWLMSRDRVAALIFGFAVLLPLGWMRLAWGVVEQYLEHGWQGFPLWGPPLYTEVGLVIALFAVCVAISLRAMLSRQPMERPEIAVGVLIVAHTLSVHVAYSLIFAAANVPIWATHLMRALGAF